jgi:hypothetical protein
MSKIPIRFYFDFFEKDWHSLPDSVASALVNFLKKLEENPDDPRVLSHTESDSKGRFAYEFAPEYIVYWRVVRKEPGEFIKLDSAKPVRIEVLAVLKNKA